MMEIIYADPYYDSIDEDVRNFTSELSAELSSLDPSISFRATNYGLGADFPAVLVEMFKDIEWPVITTSSAVAIFFLGKKVKENLDAWIDVSAKLKKIFIRRQPTFIDSNVAVCMVLQEFSSEELIDLLEISLLVTYGTSIPHGSGELGKQPYALYVVSLVFFNRTHVIGIRSTGDVVFRHTQHLTWHDFNK